MDGGTPGPSSPPGAGEAPAPPAAAAGKAAAPAGRFAWVRTASDRVPTTWFAGVAVALFLAATAGFGGLADVPVAALPQLAAGEAHDGEPLTLSVERAVLIDEFPEAGVTVEPGQRVLAILVTAENGWTRALQSAGGSGVIVQALRIADAGERAPDAVARYDDATLSPWLQPGVPAQLVATWAVEEDLLAAGDALRVDVRDLRLRRGSFVVDGEFWEEPVVAASVTLEVEDVGAGADAEGEG